MTTPSAPTLTDHLWNLAGSTLGPELVNTAFPQPPPAQQPRSSGSGLQGVAIFAKNRKSSVLNHNITLTYVSPQDWL